VKILIVEDEDLLRDGLTDLFESSGHQVVAVADGLSAVERALHPGIDVMVLDRMLPKLDGMEVLAKVRELRPSLAVLMLTARADENDRVDGLQGGADDYVTKPFSIRELLARIDALHRRTNLQNEETPQTVEIDGISLDLGRCRFRRADVEDELTAREASILRWLYLHRDRAVERSELLEKVWETRGDLATRTVDMTIANLRQKIELDPKDPHIVVTVKGRGYAWGTP
jgi:DNA-binding response OmpR family regulator